MALHQLMWETRGMKTFAQEHFVPSLSTNLASPPQSISASLSIPVLIPGFMPCGPPSVTVGSTWNQSFANLSFRDLLPKLTGKNRR